MEDCNNCMVHDGFNRAL